MSGLPAQRVGLLDRGLLRPGMKADVAVFDPDTVGDLATFERPHQYATGVSMVIVNGTVVFENGAMTAARPGRLLHGPVFVTPATARHPGERRGPASVTRIWIPASAGMTGEGAGRTRQRADGGAP
jgi:hypothetical protein